MEPKERMETLGSTKIAYTKKRLGEGEGPLDFAVAPQDADGLLEEWPDTPKKVARKLMEQYGAPNEATPTRLIWHGNGPWKRTIVFRDEVPHKFPTAHTDFVIQYIDYPIPTEKASELIEFDGSVIIDRTAGEVAARCDMEAMNVLTLNLVHDIVTGAKTVDEAREFYAEAASAHVLGRPSPYAERLQFPLPEGDTADLDESIIAAPMAKQMAAKMGDALTRSTAYPE